MYPATLPSAKLKGLYRQLLLHARAFPSVKRAAIVEDIRIEFREKAKERDPAKVANAIEVAVRGLETLRKYTNLGKRQQTWTLSLDQDPLGEAEAQQRRAATMAAELQARKTAAKPAKAPATDSLM